MFLGGSLTSLRIIGKFYMEQEEVKDDGPIHIFPVSLGLGPNLHKKEDCCN